MHPTPQARSQPAVRLQPLLACAGQSERLRGSAPFPRWMLQRPDPTGQPERNSMDRHSSVSRSAGNTLDTALSMPSDSVGRGRTQGLPSAGSPDTVVDHLDPGAGTPPPAHAETPGPASPSVARSNRAGARARRIGPREESRKPG